MTNLKNVIATATANMPISKVLQQMKTKGKGLRSWQESPTSRD